MLITKEVEVKPSGKMIKYYRDKGYDARYRKPLIVKIEDLSNGSGEYVDVLCDYCHQNIISIMYKDYIRRVEKYKTCACIECKPIKVKENNLLKYGVSNTSSLPEVKKRVQMTNIDRYGYPCSLQNKEVRQKAIDTCRSHFGVDYSIQCEAVFNATKESLKRHYGVDNPFQSNEIKEKASKSLYEHSLQKCSKQQLYLFNLYNQNNGAELNYPISYYNADICLLKEKLDIEYDGGFHNGNVITGRMTQEEFDQKELVRNNIIKRAGYKQMRIISSKDKLPSDEILLQMLSETKQYFSDYPNHSWIEYNIDTSIVRNAEHKNGVFFDYGKLRNIK